MKTLDFRFPATNFSRNAQVMTIVLHTDKNHRIQKGAFFSSNAFLGNGKRTKVVGNQDVGNANLGD